MANSLILKVFGGGEAVNRTPDTRIFSPLLYRLSYLATSGAECTETRRMCQDFSDSILFFSFSAALVLTPGI